MAGTSRTQPNFEKALVSFSRKSVLIEIVCGDAYEAAVFYDDVLVQLKSKRGLRATSTDEP